MRKYILIAIVAFLTKSNDSISQFLQNDQFSEVCKPFVQTQFNPPCVTFDQNSCINTSVNMNWTRSHGTPEIIEPGGKAFLNYAYMWANTTNFGEGMFASYHFRRNNPYIVTVTAQINSGNSNPGTMYLAAANGLVQGPLVCGSTVPSSNITLQTISNNAITATSWTTFNFTFTADNDYNQFWIYPQATNSNAQFDLLVDRVEIKPDCSGIAGYNNGVISPGQTRAGTIYAGSTYGSGGFGTVTGNLSGSIDLDFIAANEIQLLPEFRITAGTRDFNATVSNCYDGNIVGRESILLVDTPTVDPGIFFRGVPGMTEIGNEKQEKNGSVAIYPNPATNKTFIALERAACGQISIRVINSLGAVVLEKKGIIVAKGSTKIDLDVSSLQKGYYIMQIVDSDGNVHAKPFQK